MIATVSLSEVQNREEKNDQPSAVVFYIMILSIISRKQVSSNQLSITLYRIEPRFDVKKVIEHKAGQT